MNYLSAYCWYQKGLKEYLIVKIAEIFVRLRSNSQCLSLQIILEQLLYIPKYLRLISLPVLSISSNLFLVSGNWGAWGDFGTCSASCGSNGIKLRKRECNNPPAMFGGQDCPGNSIDSIPCNSQNCPGKSLQLSYLVLSEIFNTVVF